MKLDCLDERSNSEYQNISSNKLTNVYWSE